MHFVETMAYARTGGLPWHELGNGFDGVLTPDEMVIRAGLDWKVNKRPLTAEMLGVSAKSAPERFVLYRDCSGRIDAEGNPIKDDFLDIVGPQFEPIQNVDAMSVFADMCEAGHMTMETAGSLKNGKLVWGLAKTTESFRLPGKDDVEAYMLMISPHQQGQSFQCLWTPVRVVCWNTLSFALHNSVVQDRWRMRHNRSLDEKAIEEMKATLGLGTKIMTDYKDQAEFLISRKMNEAEYIRYLANLFTPELVGLIGGEDKLPKTFNGFVNLKGQELAENIVLHGRNPLYRVVNKIETQPGWSLPTAKGTAWGAFNTATWAIDHLLVAANDDGTRAYENSVGRWAAVKHKALESALDFAKAA